MAKYIIELETEETIGGMQRPISLKVNGEELNPCQYQVAGFIGGQIIAIANYLANNCDEYNESVKKLLSRSSNNKESDISYCYLMIDHNTGYHKIGRSLAPYDRERTLQSEKPTIELIWKWMGGSKEESKWHRKFKKKRIRGEWFNLDECDIETLKTETL